MNTKIELKNDINQCSKLLEVLRDFHKNHMRFNNKCQQMLHLQHI